MCLHYPLLRSAFQRRTFPFLWFPELSPASITSLSQRQLTTTEPQQSSNSLTHTLTNSLHSNCLTPRLAAISHQHLTLVTAVSRLSRNRSCFSLYNLGTDRIENTSPSSYVVTSRSYRTDRVENAASQLLHCFRLRICCLATGVFAQPFPSNGCPCWLHSSCFEQICHFAPSLRQFVPNSLQAHRQYFFSEGCVCDVCDRPRLPSPWLGSHGNYSPAAPALIHVTVYCHVLCVTIDGVWIDEWIYWPLNTHHSELLVITALPLSSTLYHLLLQTLCLLQPAVSSTAVSL
jgi:hypothetical protein